MHDELVDDDAESDRGGDGHAQLHEIGLLAEQHGERVARVLADERAPEKLDDHDERVGKGQQLVDAALLVALVNEVVRALETGERERPAVQPRVGDNGGGGQTVRREGVDRLQLLDGDVLLVVFLHQADQQQQRNHPHRPNPRAHQLARRRRGAERAGLYVEFVQGGH